MGNSRNRSRNGASASAVLDAPAVEQETAPAVEQETAPAVEQETAPAVEQPQPETPAEEQPQPETPAVDLAALVALEEITKGQRVYVDVDGVGRVPTPDGTLATVQREQRADGTLGEYMLAEVRKAKQSGQPDSIARYSIARIQALKTALESVGVTTLR